MASVSVIIPAAGQSRRFGGQNSKIFARIGNQPMFIRTLEAFTSRNDVIQILLVVSPADIETVRTDYGGHLGFMNVTLVAGGATRSESVRNALGKLDERADLVAVHDAARPCIAQPWIDAVFAEASKCGAAILAQPIVGTIKRVGESKTIDQTLPREQFDNLWEAQTPQVFQTDLLKKAYAGNADATDDAALLEAMGHPVHVVPGDPRNVKVTSKGDLGLACAVIKTLPRGRGELGWHPFK